MQGRLKKGWFSVPRLFGIGVTTALLFLILSGIDKKALAQTLAKVNGWWLGLAAAAYGCALFWGSLRWHLALRLTGAAVHFGASSRLVYIGHFFFVVLFGAAGGDLAKSMLYTQWFRIGLPEVLAAVPLDRGLGTIGQIMVVAVSFGVSFGLGGFHDWQPVEWRAVRAWWVIVVGAAVIVGLAMLCWRPRQHDPWVRGWRAFLTGAKGLISQPVLGRQALGVAMAHQLTMHTVFALNLNAVAQGPLPWLQLAWTIPAITILSCFPISFAGAGVRELAAVTLLGLYGVPASDAVAAAMLTLLVKLIWAGVGGTLFWREQTLRATHPERDPPQSISVVIPACDESGALPETISTVRRVPEVCEIIVVDGGSRDGTREVAQELGCVVTSARRSRGAQLRLGASQAKGEVVLLLHADTQLPPESGRAMLSCLRDSAVVAGGFWKVFDDPSWLLRGSRFRCAIRLWLFHRLMGDQAIFVRRETLEKVGGIPDVPLMEEFELCRLLRREGRLALAGAVVCTSARRFRSHGIVRTYLLMGRIQALYWAGTPVEELRRIYDRAVRRD